jgi:cation diffusion facilitator family transporter
VLGGWLVHLGKSTKSIILEADGHHVLSDAWTSAAVVLGIVAVALSRWWWLDSAIAIVMGLNILRTGFRLARQSLHGLLDFADPELLETIVDALASRREAGWLDLHQLRASKAGNRTFVDFHLVVPADWNVARLHDSIEHARGALRGRLGPETDVVIHFDPDTSTLLDRAEGRWSVSHAIRRPLREAADPSQLPT